MDIQTLLDGYEEILAQEQIALMDMSAKKKVLLNPIMMQLAEIEQEYTDKMAEFGKPKKVVEEKLRQAVVDQKAPITGKLVNVQYVRPSKKVKDIMALEQFLKAHPTIAKKYPEISIEEGKPTTRIVGLGKSGGFE